MNSLNQETPVIESIEGHPKTAPRLRRYSESDFDGYRAAPLLVVGEDRDPMLVHRQERLMKTFVDAAQGELSPIAKPDIVTFVQNAITSRMHQREGLNGMVYAFRLHDTPNTAMVPEEHPDYVERACWLAAHGEGTPYENHIARRAWGMATGEIANLTIINGFRRHLEPHMWGDISDITGTDVRPSSKNTSDIRILGFDRTPKSSQHMAAMRIGMKRTIAALDDGVVMKSRTTAIINTSPSSGFDQSIIEEFRDVKPSPEDLKEMAALPSFQRAVRWLIDTIPPAGLVLARNETVYEYHAETDAAVRRLHAINFPEEVTD